MLLSMYKAGKLNIADMITREYRLRPDQQGLHGHARGRNIRGVIRYRRRLVADGAWPFPSFSGFGALKVSGESRLPS